MSQNLAMVPWEPDYFWSSPHPQAQPSEVSTQRKGSPNTPPSSLISPGAPQHLCPNFQPQNLKEKAFQRPGSHPSSQMSLNQFPLNWLISDASDNLLLLFDTRLFCLPSAGRLVLLQSLLILKESRMLCRKFLRYLVFKRYPIF